MISHETTLVFTEPVLRRAVLAYWRRSIGFGFVAAMTVVALCLGLLLAQGNGSWVVGVLASTLFLGIGFSVALYVIHYRNTLRILREMGTPRATFRAEEAYFTITSSIGTVTYQWAAIKELWRFPEVWLLLYSRTQFSTLPVAYMPAQMQDYIVQHVRAVGGKVSG